MQKSLISKMLFLAVIIITFVVVNIVITNNRMNEISGVTYSNYFVNQIESVDIEEKQLKISGWCFGLKDFANVMVENYIDCSELRVGLVEINNDENADHAIFGNVERILRNDVNEYFSRSNEYTECGFVAFFNSSKVDLDNKIYEVVFKVAEDSKAIGTNTYICKDGIVNKLNSTGIPKTDGTDLKNIINHSTIIMADDNIGTYVCQGEDSLYILLSPEYSFDELGCTRIVYRAYTTQYDNLPSDKLDKGQYYDTVNFDFEENEITDQLNCGSYRVAVFKYPMNYSITLMELGEYSDEGWVWKKSFMPDFTQLMEHNA